MGLNRQVAQPSKLWPMIVCFMPTLFPDSTDLSSIIALQVWQDPSMMRHLVSLAWCQPCCRCSLMSTTQRLQPLRLRPSWVVIPAFSVR